MNNNKKLKQELVNTLATEQYGSDAYNVAKAKYNDICELEKKSQMSDTCKAAIISAGGTIVAVGFLAIIEHVGPLVAKNAIKFLK